MPWLDFAALDRASAAFDAAVAQTPAIDRFCSTSDWVLPAQAAFTPTAQPFIAQHEGCTVALMQVEVPGGRIAVPLEAGWGLAAPIVGPDPQLGAALLAAMLEQAETPPHVLFLSGVQRDGPWFEALVARFGRHYSLGLGEVCVRRMAALDAGVDGWLAQRTPKFRANLRRSWRKAQADGFAFEYRREVADPAALFARVMAMEGASWKGASGQGVDEGPARDFYRLMTPRLAAKGALRAVLATRDGRDAGFVLGGVFDGTYRGLQVSFVDAFRPWGVGNLLQYAMIRGLAAEGGVRCYDLGTDMPYKARWAEQVFETVTLTVRPRAAPLF